MHLGACTHLPLPRAGSEDIVVDERAGVAFISSDPHKSERKPHGAIYAYPLASRAAPTVATDAADIGPFRPHGMGLFTGGGERRLFVVNHGRARDAVEIFRVDGARLVHLETLQDPQLIRGNDVVPVGPRSFYVTNSQVSRTGVGRGVEGLLTRGHSYVLFYDGEKFTRVANGLSFANGVNVSADGAYLYASATIGRDLRVYRRGADGTHARVRRIRTGTGLDNIEVDSTGGLWVAAHPRLGKFLGHAANPRRPSPSQVLYFPNVNGLPGDPVLVRADSLRSGTSVAVRRGNRLLLGSVFDVAMDCELLGGPPP